MITNFPLFMNPYALVTNATYGNSVKHLVNKDHTFRIRLYRTDGWSLSKVRRVFGVRLSSQLEVLGDISIFQTKATYGYEKRTNRSFIHLTSGRTPIPSSLRLLWAYTFISFSY
jgi:hypothetical protein